MAKLGNILKLNIIFYLSHFLERFPLTISLLISASALESHLPNDRSYSPLATEYTTQSLNCYEYSWPKLLLTPKFETEVNFDIILIVWIFDKNKANMKQFILTIY